MTGKALPFSDISNTETGQGEGGPTVVKTFSRRNRLNNKVPARESRPLEFADADEASKADSAAIDPRTGKSASYDFEVAADSTAAKEEEAAGSKAADKKGRRTRKGEAAEGDRGYSRKVAPSAKEQKHATREAYFADMRAYFAEVGGFELQEASPSTVGRAASISPAPEHAQEAETHSPWLHAEHASASLQLCPSPYSQSVVRQIAAWVPNTSPLPILPLADELLPPVERPRAPGTASLRETEATGKLLAGVQRSSDSKPSEEPLEAASLTQGHAEEDSGMWEDNEEGAARQLQNDVGDKRACPGSARRDHLHAPLTPVTKGSERESNSLPCATPASGSAAAGEASEMVQASAYKPQGSQRKAPALGMSRRSSICFANQDLNASLAAAGRRSSIVKPAGQRTSLAGKPRDELDLKSHDAQPQQERHPRRSMLSRLSDRFSLDQGFARLSIGLSESLHRLGLSGALPASQQETAENGQTEAPFPRRSSRMSFEGLHSPAARNIPAPQRASIWGIQEFSPIAESPEAGSNAAPTPSSAISEEAVSADVAEVTTALAGQLVLEEHEYCSQAGNEIVSQEGPLTPLQELLRVCDQDVDEAAIPSMTALLGQHVDLQQVRKIGEGTFGEAFKGGSVVFKIVPMDGALLVNGEVQKRSHEILAEVAISLTLSQLRGLSGEEPSNATAGFVETHGVGVCRGRYAPALLREWHAWDARHGSENDPVDAFPADQLYGVFVVADGGIDLERFEPHDFAEARALLLQCALTLAVAEEACEFEHRDLHWGNLLVKRDLLHTSRFRLRGVDIEVRTEGLAVTLIDFTLSRLRTLTSDIAFCDLSADPEIFQGPKGECQADTYRRMKKATKGNWQKHTACTNALWMHYLADTLLTKKQIPLTAQQKRELRGFRKRAIAAESCSALLWDEFFSGMWLAGRQSADLFK